MFAFAAISREVASASECRSRFDLWLDVVDPGHRFFQPLFRSPTAWGWLGVAGGGAPLAQALESRTPGDTRLWVHGLVLNAELNAALERGQDLVSLLSRLRTANGQFLYVLLGGGQAPAFECGTDCLGMRPLYANDLRSPSVVSNYSSLAGVLSGRLDLEAAHVLDFALKDSVLPNASMIQGICRLNRGDAVRLEEATLRVASCEHRNLTRPDVSEDQAVEDILDSLQALPRLGRRLLLGLTGGKDSRLMMAMLMAAKVDFECATHNHPCKDSLLAGQLARRAGARYWPVPRGHSSPGRLLPRYLSLLPFSEGVQPLSDLDPADTVHELAAVRGMVHVGGLGGEVLRGYWDPFEADLHDPGQSLDIKFFQPKFDFLYPPGAMERSRQAWHALVDDRSGVDEFVCVHVAYLDARLRGTIATRTNAAWYDYAWPLANRLLYAHALGKPRKQRQDGDIFESLIRRLAPSLLEVPWAGGAAGYFGGRGLRNRLRNLRIRLGRVPALQMLRGRLGRLRGMVQPRTPSAAQRILSAFLEERDVQHWLAEIVSPAAVRYLLSGSATFQPALTAFFALYHFGLFLNRLKASSGAAGGDWRAEAAGRILDALEARGP
ncbi:MAG: hypothetical protein BWX88_01712 [Planctomycetes bacterium ADurb.Bin126]|nr:MAG: hypothetical protein BWX88_01712 [Planctomycetes bacterium ADurb.Bin126]HOD83293.1 hypothetical protein [Phycisphaerae bacterium]HQL73169.1 hypothetical protein [Phycisphaerae bacterium]